MAVRARCVFDTPALAHRPFLARRRGKCRLWRWHPSGTRRGSAIAFGIARAIPPTDGDAWDQFSPRPSRGGRTKSFEEGEHPQWSTSAGSGSLRDQAVNGRSLRAGSLGPPERGQTTKRGVAPCAPDLGRCQLQNTGAHGCFSIDRKHQRFGTRVVELACGRLALWKTRFARLRTCSRMTGIRLADTRLRDFHLVNRPNTQPGIPDAVPASDLFTSERRSSPPQCRASARQHAIR